MIPTYNGTTFLKETLQSILSQAPSPEQMQIEVIDDCSTEGNPKKLVQEVGQGRVSFFRQPHNLGLIGNWNSCIERSCGQWVHILHQDDIVLPGFYQQLEAATTSSVDVGAAFCRHAFINEDGHQLGTVAEEQEEAGILDDWIYRIATQQRIQFPSIVVARSTYEKLGGFYADVHYAADWEMWKRIAAHYKIWYEPKTLACYRQHTASETSRLVRSGANISDIRKAIKVSQSYLPEELADQLSKQARESYANHALHLAKKMLKGNDFVGAVTQISESLKCECSAEHILNVVRLMALEMKHLYFYKNR